MSLMKHIIHLMHVLDPVSRPESDILLLYSPFFYVSQKMNKEKESSIYAHSTTIG
jgi:hypothetical protein